MVSKGFVTCSCCTERTEAQSALLAEQLEALAVLRRLALEMAGALAARAREWVEPNAGAEFARVAQAVRRTIALEAHLSAGLPLPGFDLVGEKRPAARPERAGPADAGLAAQSPAGLTRTEVLELASESRLGLAADLGSAPERFGDEYRGDFASWLKRPIEVCLFGLRWLLDDTQKAMEARDAPKPPRKPYRADPNCADNFNTVFTKDTFVPRPPEPEPPPQPPPSGRMFPDSYYPPARTVEVLEPDPSGGSP